MKLLLQVISILVFTFTFCAFVTVECLDSAESDYNGIRRHSVNRVQRVLRTELMDNHILTHLHYDRGAFLIIYFISFNVAC